ncbi:PBP1A family penicillin-binding protein [Phreatobacter aquaticus]|uniref:PBP1A family penicillin-binding protein n=2 Tax=Phreatobacter aquaticus TaxID=2570229 RepID=A0A4D7QUR2_9HYPH|nr:PBP1A family penicillin-binding protein [Phreatobacter aquaticus]
MTLGSLGMIVLLMLAIPAFRETSEDWRKKSELSVVFQDRYGNEVGRRGIRHNDSVPLDDFPDHLIKAVLATEDRRFFEHYGIDLVGTLRAVAANARARGVVQGGSTITQQLAKNLFLTNERSFERKIKEAFLALWLEARASKKEILKTYLDRAYMGGGAFGAEAAAEYYFGKSVRDVTLAEAAMLAGLFKAPTRFAPHANLPAARGRANTVLDNLVEAGFMTEGQVFGARRNPATPVDRKDEVVPNYYLDYAFEDIKRLVAATPTLTDRVLTVRTGLDLSVQRQAELAVEQTLRQYGTEYGASQAALVLMDTDGTVRAIVGGRDYGASQFNRATEAMRQPGSSFKPIVYGTALREGLITSRSVVVDRPICLGNWCPQNYGRSFSGSTTVFSALVRSINSIPVILTQQMGRGDSRLGRQKIIQAAREMGITRPLTDSAPLPIGAAEVTLVELTNAYATFASGGRSVSAHAAVEIKNSQGDVIWRGDRDMVRRQVFTPQVAADMNAMLVGVVESGTGRRAAVEGVQVGGKTGTTNSYRDALFVGFSGQFVAGIWYGNDDYSETNRMTGGSLPAMTFSRVMTAAHQGLEPRPVFGQPERARPATAAPNSAPLPQAGISERPQVLSRRSLQVLTRIDRLLRDAQEAPTRPGPLSSAEPASTVLR